MKRSAFLLSFSLFIASIGLNAAQASQEAQDLVVSTTQALLQELKDNREKINSDAAYLNDFLEQKVVPYLDFVAMTKLAVATHWRSASAEEQAALVAEFKTLLLRTYSKSVREYSGEDIVFLPYRPGERANERAVVQSEFHTKNGQTIPLAYKLRKTDAWRIYDIAIDGISLVTNYRTTFDSEISKGGIKGLIASLHDKNQAPAQ